MDIKIARVRFARVSERTLFFVGQDGFSFFSRVPVKKGKNHNANGVEVFFGRNRI